MPHEFLVGIDLGTSNCAVALVDPSTGSGAAIADFPVLQVRQPGNVSAAPLLPSAIYIKGEHELPSEAVALTWDATPQNNVCEFAHTQGAQVPGRLVICCQEIGCPIPPSIVPLGDHFPGEPQAEVPKMSPVDASCLLLRHMRESWNFSYPDALLENQEVVITVPASFDEVARALTVNAAKQAGFDKFTLVEEPQAAFYDFIAKHRQDLAQVLDGVKLVLVIDVGGGTSDFTLVRVGDGQNLRRIAVGDHLMLGGDNMDAAIARHAEARMKAAGKLSSTQWTQLVQASRLAKESLLSSDAPQSYHLSVVSEGSLSLLADRCRHI